ncbi:FitA-like ribbon-helix-helix domain-containing protein [Geodermatophilus sp. SYSU D00697]
MARVIQIRDVPDDVHDALRAAARTRGQSLTKFVLAELEQVARRARTVEADAEVIRPAQRAISAHVPREEVLAALHEGRGE